MGYRGDRMSKRVEDKGRKWKHLNPFERGQIAALHKEGYSAYRIGKILGRSADTIRNELKRGTTTVIINSFERERYFPETGQAIYEKNRKHCFCPLKAKRCGRFIAYIEDELFRHKHSFDSARGYALKNGLFAKEDVVCVTTLYSYVERGVINVRNIDLPERVGRRVKKSRRPLRDAKRLKGRSIEERPKAVDEKKEFGHWEIDLVVGQRSGDCVLLTLTERKTKKEIIRKIKNKSPEEVMKALYRLEQEIPYFDKVFKSITSDNGKEFSHLYELEEGRSIRVYYAHPYSSWERPLNELTNRIIRRFIPKGKAIKRYSQEKIEQIEEWINELPRRILGYCTAEECYQIELGKLLG